jgi:hypothetical protein
MRFGEKAISFLHARSVGGGSIFGIDATMLGSICMGDFNPKYWATRHSVFDIASRQNALPAIQAENMPQRNPVDHS